MVLADVVDLTGEGSDDSGGGGAAGRAADPAAGGAGRRARAGAGRGPAASAGGGRAQQAREREQGAGHASAAPKARREPGPAVTAQRARAAGAAASEQEKASHRSAAREPKRQRTQPPSKLGATERVSQRVAVTVAAEVAAAAQQQQRGEARGPVEAKPLDRRGPLRPQKRKAREGIEAGVDSQRDNETAAAFARHVLQRDLWRAGPDPAVAALAIEFRSHRAYTDAFKAVMLEECREGLRQEVLEGLDKAAAVVSMRLLRKHGEEAEEAEGAPRLLLAELERPANLAEGTIVGLHRGEATREALEGLAVAAAGRARDGGEAAAGKGGATLPGSAGLQLVYGSVMGPQMGRRLLSEEWKRLSRAHVLIEVPAPLSADALALCDAVSRSRQDGWTLVDGSSMVPARRQWSALNGMSKMDKDVVQAILLPASTHAEHGLSAGAEPPQLERECTPRFLDHLEGQFNPSQLLAVRWAARKAIASLPTHAQGHKWPFTLIQGPPGTGKTHTVWGLLNVLHLIRYQHFYRFVKQQYNALDEEGDEPAAPGSPGPLAGLSSPGVVRSDAGGTSRLRRLGVAEDDSSMVKRVSRPKLLVCAPSNAACDELVRRVMERQFLDGEGKQYRPEIARLGSGDKLSSNAQHIATGWRAKNYVDRPMEEKMNFRIQSAAHAEHLKQLIYNTTRSLRQMGQRSAVEKAEPTFITHKEEIVQRLMQLTEELHKHEVEVLRWSIALECDPRDPNAGRFVRGKLEELELSCAREAEIVFATLSGSVHRLVGDSTRGGSARFDTVIIDEAAQASEVECLQPLLVGCSNIIMVGDPRQLPATVLSTHASRLKLDRSLFQRLQGAGVESVLLDTQYRMNPLIREFPSRHFYECRIKDGANVLSRAPLFPAPALEDGQVHDPPLPPLPSAPPTRLVAVPVAPTMFVDVAGTESRGATRGGSLMNRAEAGVAVDLYDRLRRCTPPQTTFCVLTPYRRQLSCIRDAFRQAFGGNVLDIVTVSTIDGFQGQERDVVIMSCVRAASSGRIGFLADVRRMNVAITRPRHCLLVLGSAGTLEKGETWGSFIAHAKQRQCFVRAGPLIAGIDAALKAAGGGLPVGGPSKEFPRPGEHHGQHLQYHSHHGQMVMRQQMMAGLPLQQQQGGRAPPPAMGAFALQRGGRGQPPPPPPGAGGAYWPR